MSLTGKVWDPLFTPEQRKAFLAQLIDMPTRRRMLEGEWVCEENPDDHATHDEEAYLVDAVAKAIREGGSHA
jgi:hypothetical protein